MRLRSAQLLRAFIGPEPDKKLSARQLARTAAVHPSFINHLTSGRTASCTPRVADRISDALGVPTDVLFEERVSSTGRATVDRGM
ncbi:helix-turn-helix domain-containing protein [Mycobacteroides abscessus]|uniref:helix-turn-helix domain-containing protein n=1 Tax=Mycobacteroides abscessus TaxID=36809 RepID=UPI000C2563D1